VTHGPARRDDRNPFAMGDFTDPPVTVHERPA
jgi:hypothetical protein